ncbi:DUF6115 domain-containing protein [Fusibacter ferrireducens]|uniref:Uncharacterized protein n=1 Tax=Fusibacter ferrireducens TaxID=2785058 RepID=A0ABR9ZP42_9FIRM|nr:hypothetical protein [Fusibacter ferrireducens]MBF4691756.1 hypothetical protein [Fusibacter ferrireducens]
MYVISIIFGLIIVISSIFMIRRELNRAIVKREQLLEHSRFYKDEDLFTLMENLQISIDEMNNAFYNIADDLEGKYSQHEKEIELLNEKVDSVLERFQSGMDQSAADESLKASVVAHKAKMDLSKNELKSIKQSEPAVQDEIVDFKSDATLREKVVKLRSEGLSLKAIAKELDMGIGELQLLIQLPDVTKKT